ncbi:aldehyde dehydrogenase family protein [Streptomyces sp. NPDC001796]|uniref:aldehyde dehydrogenase family protein n=1 Tax=Streptomyces sp. NPDC001796 TaxID=3364609 RepID=UPI0036CBEB58
MAHPQIRRAGPPRRKTMTVSGLRTALSTLVPAGHPPVEHHGVSWSHGMPWGEFTMDPNHLLVGGRWVHTSSDRVIDVASASTGDHLATVPDGSQDDIDRAVGAARAAFDAPAGWASWGPEHRAAAMIRLADALEARKEATSTAVSAQNGMPITVARSFEGVVPSALLRYYAGLADSMTSEELRTGLPRGTTLVRREPAGVVAAIMTWNFPQTIAFFKMAPALAAGCALVLKPAPETVLDSVAVGRGGRGSGDPRRRDQHRSGRPRHRRVSGLPS